jgi:hypothetical protein
VPGIIALALILCVVTLIGLRLLLSFGRDVMKAATPGEEPEALRSAATFVRAIRPRSGGAIAALAKPFHPHG